MSKTVVDVGKDFSRYPAGRFAEDGPYSGERFREEYLIPGLKLGKNIEVLLDDTAGYGSSFLEEAFGGLLRRGISESDVTKLLTLTTEDSALRLEIFGYIKDEARRRSG